MVVAEISVELGRRRRNWELEQRVHDRLQEKLKMVYSKIWITGGGKGVGENTILESRE